MNSQLSVKTIPFMGDELMAAKDEKSGKIYAGVRWMCEGIGLSSDQARNERRRIHDDLVLSKGESNLPLPTKGGIQSVQCIDNEFVPLWLAKISITPAMRKEHPEVADKLVQYQLKAQKVLADAFLHHKAPSAKSKYRALPPVNHSVEILQKAWLAAGVDQKRAAAAVSGIYKQVYGDLGIDIPGAPVECDKTYDKGQIAKALGVYSKSGKPHSQAIAAIIRTMNIPADLIEHSPFAANGHSDDYDRYKAPVLDMVRNWLASQNVSDPIVLDKSYHVVYR